MDVTDYEWSKDTAACQILIEAVNWPNVQAYASTLNEGKSCNAEAPVGVGGRHFVRILTFEGGKRWLARFPKHSNDKTDATMLREIDCLRIVAERSNAPVPKVFAVVSRKPEYGAAFTLMECLPGNVGMDVNDAIVPEQHKAKFFKQMANAQVRKPNQQVRRTSMLTHSPQVQFSSILLPRIGVPVRLDDGTVTIEPIPGIGGPFDTASAFFRAWAAAATFPLSEQRIRELSGPYGDEIWDSTKTFPVKLGELANSIAGAYDSGPFPLVHTDYGHNNIIVDAEYNLLGVIDWEGAIAAPWGMVEFPLTVRTIPVSIDAPWNYTSDWSPKDAHTMSDHKDREEYLQALRDAEKELGIPPKLSEVLSNQRIRDVAAAMKFFAIDGKLAWYSKVLDEYENVAVN